MKSSKKTAQSKKGSKGEDSTQSVVQPRGGLPEEHIERIMSGAPGLWDSRATIFTHMMLRLGTGYQWLKDGSMGSIYDPYPFIPKQKNPMEDIEESIKQLNERRELFKDNLGAKDDTDFQLCKLELERINRQHVLDNLSLYAKHHKGAIKLSSLLDSTTTPEILNDWVSLKTTHPQWNEAVLECARGVHMALRSLTEEQKEQLTPYQKKAVAQWTSTISAVDEKLQKTLGVGVFLSPDIANRIAKALNLKM